MAKNLLAISLGAIGLDLESLAGTREPRTDLARFYGEATDVRPGRKGQLTVMGDFRAVNLQTGEEFKSSVIYLPSGLQERIIVGVDNAANMVRFAFDIWAEPDPKGRSYSLGFADLTEDEKAPDPLANFAKGLPPIPKAIATK